MTAFTRIIIVLSMLRQALGMQETPPNMVLVSLALFLTLFTMLPVVKEINDTFHPDHHRALDAAPGARNAGDAAQHGAGEPRAVSHFVHHAACGEGDQRHLSPGSSSCSRCCARRSECRRRRPTWCW